MQVAVTNAQSLIGYDTQPQTKQNLVGKLFTCQRISMPDKRIGSPLARTVALQCNF